MDSCFPDAELIEVLFVYIVRYVVATGQRHIPNDFTIKEKSSGERITRPPTNRKKSKALKMCVKSSAGP